MARNSKEKEGGSTTVIALSALLALGAAGGVYYCYDEAAKSESLLQRSKEEYKKMAEWKKPVEDWLRSTKGKPDKTETAVDPMVFLDQKARESQIPPGAITFSKNPPTNLAAWSETTYTASLTGGKDPIKKFPLVDFIRKVETERRSTKVKALQLVFNGDDFKSATITFSQFTPK